MYSTRDDADGTAAAKNERGKSPALRPLVSQKREIIHAHVANVRLSTLVCPDFHAHHAADTAAVTATDTATATAIAAATATAAATAAA